MWMEFSIQLRLVSLIKLILHLSCRVNIQAREPYLCGFAQKKKACNWTLTEQFFQICCDDRDHYALHFDSCLDDLDLQSRSQLYEKLNTSVPFFCLCKFPI